MSTTEVSKVCNTFPFPPPLLSFSLLAEQIRMNANLYSDLSWETMKALSEAMIEKWLTLASVSLPAEGPRAVDLRIDWCCSCECCCWCCCCLCCCCCCCCSFCFCLAVAVAVAVVNTVRIKDVEAYKAVKITSNRVKSYPFGVPRAMLIIILASDCRKKPQEDLEVDCSGFWR